MNLCTVCLVSNPNPSADFGVFPYCFGAMSVRGVYNCEERVDDRTAFMRAFGYSAPSLRLPVCESERRTRIPGKRALRFLKVA